MRVLFALLAALVLCSPAMAGDLTVSVRDTAGRPVQDAVVTVHPAAGVPRGAIRFAWPLRMSQQDIQFQPYVLVVPVGGTVSFPNLDRVRHQVYSFSRGNRFELQLYGRDESRTHTLQYPRSDAGLYQGRRHALGRQDPGQRRRDPAGHTRRRSHASRLASPARRPRQ